jgi:GNAT superfamily N-acetyltransferase
MRILALVVGQNSRKLGIGKMLVAAAESWAAEQGLTTVLVNSGNREERIPAHRFYENMGYEVKSSGFVKKL